MEQLSGVRLIAMQAEEYAKIFRGKHERIINHNGIIWTAVRPFFWRPLFPFSKFDFDKTRVPLFFYVGGFQYSLLDNEKSNSTINYYIFDNIKEYGLDNLDKHNRKDIVRSMKYLHVETMDDFEDFIKISYPVYMSFLERTQYSYRKDRSRERVYNNWWKNIFSSGKLLVLGAYYEDILVGVRVLAYVEGVVVLVTSFVHTDYMKYRPSDLLVHEARVLAAKTEGAKFVFAGNKTDNVGINNFKENRGAILVKSPSYYYINPIARNMLKMFGGKYLNKITGNT